MRLSFCTLFALHPHPSLTIPYLSHSLPPSLPPYPTHNQTHFLSLLHTPSLSLICILYHILCSTSLRYLLLSFPINLNSHHSFLLSLSFNYSYTPFRNISIKSFPNFSNSLPTYFYSVQSSFSSHHF